MTDIQYEKIVYVHVRLSDAERTKTWRSFKAETLSAAVKIAEQMPDVEVCLEASWIPGGIET